jgi:imidazole glycerol-phosphate synthase subunit HisH
VRAGIVDYRMGNLASVSKAFEAAGARAFVSDEPSELGSSKLLVLPGVGNFAAGMENLSGLGLADFVIDWAADGKPLLGICMGMQLLFEESDEGPAKGLGILPGRVVRLGGQVKVPHMGWNQVAPVRESEVFGSFGGRYYYFVHSYVCEADEKTAAARTDYGGEFISAVEYGAVYGVQFHPEKSSDDGLALLRRLIRVLG